MAHNQGELLDEAQADQQKIKSEKVRLIYRISLLDGITQTAVALLLGIYLWLSADAGPIALAWALYFVVIAMIRAALHFKYKTIESEKVEPDSWIKISIVIMLACGIGWGFGGYWFFDAMPPQSGLVLSIAVAGILVAGSLLQSPSQAVFLSFAIPTFLPITLKLLMSGGDVHFVAAALLTVLFITMFFNASRLRGNLHQSVGLAVENSRLVEVLSKSNTKLESVNSQLSNEVSGRSRIEAELKAAKMSAEAANMAKDEFLATMSHEIRTPLNGILPILDILSSTKLTPVQQDYLSTASQSSKHLLTIIDDILDYSKIEAGKLELEIVGINLRELLDSVTRLMAGSAQKKGLELNVQIDPKVRVAMRGDPVRLRQILTNLVSNAIKFTDKGSVTISIGKRAESGSETELLFTVRDTGIGMDKATADKLFTPFAQADASTTRTYGGSGLGLAICKRLVEVMQGKIGVKSQPGQGSVFWFTARLKKSIGDIQKPRKQLHEANALIMSEDPQLLRRLTQFAENFGLRKSTAGKLNEALNKIKSVAALGSSWAFDLFIFDMDSTVHGNKVRDLAKAVRSESKLPDAGVLLLNASGDKPKEIAEIDGIATRQRTASESTIRECLETLLIGEGDITSDAVVEGELGDMPAADTLSSSVGGKALLVEDNPVNLHVAQKLLGIVGIDFEVAKNGQEALQLLQQQHFDLVLMDCMMPIKDGYTATREWRNIEQRKQLPRLPIIAMTANAMAGDREKCLDAGMDDYMSKPLNRQVLGNMIHQWLQKTRQRQPVKTPAPAAPKPALQVKPAAVPVEQPAPTPGRTKALDQQILDDLTDIMGDDFADLITVYLEDSPRALNRLASAAETGSINDLIDPAHSLKSSSANLGALKLSEMAKALEHDARGGSVDMAVERVQKMLQHYKQVASELKAYQ